LDRGAGQAPENVELKNTTVMASHRENQGELNDIYIYTVYKCHKFLANEKLI
jgi:hypothetical protein